MELQTIARACGKSHVHNLEPEDLVALTVEAAAMAQRAARRHQLDTGQERRCSLFVLRLGRSEQPKSEGRLTVTTDLAKIAKEREIKYFLISFVDLFGVLRAKLVPAAAIGEMQRDGAGFAGFATWLDMTPAHPDMFAMPDPDSLIQLPWKPEVGWLASDLWMDGKEVAASPRAQLKRRSVARAAKNG